MQGFNEDCSDNVEIKETWSKIRALCFSILEKSLNLLYSDKNEILHEIEDSIEKASTDTLSANKCILYMNYISSDDVCK